MSLSTALSIAQSALASNAAQSSLLSTNIANVSNTNYSLESAATLSTVSGGVTTAATQRATNAAVLSSLLSAQSSSASSQALSDGLNQLESTLGLNDTSSTSSTTAAGDNSPATLIGSLENALQSYAAAPAQDALGTAAVSAAQSLASSLDQASANVQSVRAQADSDIAGSVQTINSLLQQFQTVNTQIVAGTQAGTDVSSAQDTRDGLLKQLSSQIGITTTQGANGGTAIYTDSGATLFNVTARNVAFTPTTTYTAGTVGNAVTVDGVPVTGPSAIMPIQSGQLAGLTELRDTTAVSYQNQLDQMASSLITTFAESDQTGGSAPTEPGLFTATGLSGMPTSADTTGLAASITVNANVDPSQGGQVTRLRDGGIANPTNPAYTYNTTGAASFSGRLQQLATALDATQSFDPTSGGAASGNLATYAASSVSWLENARETATNQSTYTSALVGTTTTALSNATGVNLDTEMSSMLDVEHAYQASAQLMNTVNSMYGSLLQAFN